MSTPARCWPRPIFLLLICLLLVSSCSAALGAGSFALPKGAEWADWSALRAERDGAWQTSEPSGFGARYLQPQAEGASLVFRFTAKEPMTLQFHPDWWRTGEQKLAKRFPYPLESQFGPGTVDYVGTTIFAAAPAAGAVVAIDAVNERVLATLNVGGYVSDLVADRARGMVYVTDPLWDRVVAIDANSRRVLGDVYVPGGPWAIALVGDRVFVACRDSKKLLIGDVTKQDIIKTLDLPATPVSLEVAGNPPTQVIVRYQSPVYDAVTLAPAPAEQTEYSVPKPGTFSEGCGGPTCECMWYEEAGPHQISYGGPKHPRIVLDTSVVTKGPADSAVVARFGDHPGPSIVTKVYPTRNKPVTFFASPSRGVVGVAEHADTPSFQAIQVGGYIAGLMDMGGKLYVADAAGNRVVIIDEQTRKIEREIALPVSPSQMGAVAEVALQRDDPKMWPRRQLNRLYVTSRDSHELVAVDTTTQQVAARAPLAGEGRALIALLPPNPDWWAILSDERIPIALEPRIAVMLQPDAVDVANLTLTAAPTSVSLSGPARTSVTVAVDGGKTKAFEASDRLVVMVDKTRQIDVSAAADPQLRPARALTAKDVPGSITFSIDGGPEYDWAAGQWIAPQDEMFLVNGSEAFWRANGPVFRMGPGEHVVRVRAHSQYARLQGVSVRRTPGPQLEMTVRPMPEETHGAVPLASYGGVFYDQEPVQFKAMIVNHGLGDMTPRLSVSLRNYMGEEVQSSSTTVSLPGSTTGGSAQFVPLAFAPKDTGRFTLTLTLDTPQGQVAQTVRFLRLPKLEHPRMFFRKEEMPAIQARIAQYPNLFRRYAEWLERMSTKEGRFPERFLPPGMTAQDCASVAPADVPAEAAEGTCGWRNYELGWRVLADELALTFLKPDSQVLKEKVAGLRQAEKVDEYCQFHHHGPFFPGVDASLLDLAADPAKDAPKVYQQMLKGVGQMDELPWTLVTLEEPLTPEKRALIYRIMNYENNAEQYFTVHTGKRGGTWWMDPYTWCHCPMHGYALMFMHLHNVFGEPRLFEKPVFANFLTFLRYADPYRDARKLQPNTRGPNGEPWHWIFASLVRHPLEKSSYQWDQWIEKMNGPLSGDEAAAVDKLMALDGIDLKGPMEGAANYFVSGVSVPMALALGWYDPKAPEVSWQETPPTAFLDGEGWAAMRSGFDAKAAEVSFVSGVRDHTTRHKPNHFTITKAGQYLIGTPALDTDDGNNTGAWGNTVVVDDAWREQWGWNLLHARQGEHLVINRFPPATFTYLDRDQTRFRYKAAEGGWGGGLDLHGHTETLFMREGSILAFQTWPQLDFVAGDAANAWPADQVAQLDRQLVFLKPDLVVVYDRVKLGPNGHTTRWIAAAGQEVKAQGDSFLVRAGSEFLAGRVLLPHGATATAPEPYPAGWRWKDQRLLEIVPAQASPSLEYLVVMRVGGGDAPLPAMQTLQEARQAGVKLTLNGRAIEVRLNRAGPVGGNVTVAANGRTAQYPLREAVEDNYDHWHSDPRYPEWTSQDRFQFVVR